MITAIHGFLGLPSDWDFLRQAGFDVDARRMDDIPRSGDVLLGYSMGGRLCVRALLDGARYRRAVIVSASLGLSDAHARDSRRKSDEAWARRFESAEWQPLMRDWNAQPVFQGHVMDRREADFDRAALANALRQWSPGVLPDVAGRLHEITVPVLWIAGERDEKYAGEAHRAASLLPHGEVWICPGAGHRVPWEQPDLFVRRLQAL